METFVFSKTCSSICDTPSHFSLSRPQPILSETERYGEKYILFNCRGNRTNTEFHLTEKITKWHKPRHWYSCYAVLHTMWFHVFKAQSQAVIAGFLAGPFLCDLQIKHLSWDVHLYPSKITITILFTVTLLPDSRQNVHLFPVQHTLLSSFLFINK